MILSRRFLSSRSSISRLGYAMSPTTTSSPELGPYSGWTRERLIERLTLLETANKQEPILPSSAAIPSSGVSKTMPPNLPTEPQEKPFDFSRHARRKIALKFCYSGWEYGGLAFQKGPTPLPTVENVLFDALAKARLVDPEAGFDGCGWDKCGRTDRGVSAAGQVVSLWIRSSIPFDEIEGGKMAAENPSIYDSPIERQPKLEIDYLGTVNRLLPATIRVLAWSPVSATFSARFSCKYRHYKYFFSHTGLSIPLMQQAADRLIGEHDFRNLCKLDPQKQITSFKRNILRASIEPLEGDNGEGMYVFNLVGSAFLYHQVRHIMSVLFLVGSGLESPEIVTTLMNVEGGLEPRWEDDSLDGLYPIVDRKPEYQMADALPLMLWECGYDPADLSWRTTGQEVVPQSQETNGDVKASLVATGGLYQQLEAICDRSRIFTVLDRHFLLSASEHHPPPEPVFPLTNGPKELTSMKQTVNVPLGGGTFKRTVKYVPVLDRKRLDTVEVANERWRLGKGMRRDLKKSSGTGADVDDGNE